MSTPHLLDHLAALVRQTCLSELRRTPEVRLALLCTPASAFPAPMWREALYYLAGEALPGAPRPAGNSFLHTTSAWRMRRDPPGFPEKDAPPPLTAPPIGDIVPLSKRL